jgi:hypothetical protein
MTPQKKETGARQCERGLLADYRLCFTLNSATMIVFFLLPAELPSDFPSSTIFQLLRDDSRPQGRHSMFRN